MSQTKTGVAKVGRVIVPVTDQDRAIDFYVQNLGFEKTADTPFGNGDRWVEVITRRGAHRACPGRAAPRRPRRHRDRHRARHRRRRRAARPPARARRRRRRRGHAHGGSRAADVLLSRPGRQQTARRPAATLTADRPSVEHRWSTGPAAKLPTATLSGRARTPQGHPQRRDRRPRRPRQDHARRRHALAVRRVPRRPGRQRPRHGLDGPRAREGHHDPRQEHLACATATSSSTSSTPPATPTSAARSSAG